MLIYRTIKDGDDPNLTIVRCRDTGRSFLPFHRVFTAAEMRAFRFPWSLWLAMRREAIDELLVLFGEESVRRFRRVEVAMVGAIAILCIGLASFAFVSCASSDRPGAERASAPAARRPASTWTDEEMSAWARSRRILPRDEMAFVFDRMREIRNDIGICRAILVAEKKSVGDMGDRPHVLAARRYLGSFTNAEVTRVIDRDATAIGCPAPDLKRRYEEIAKP